MKRWYVLQAFAGYEEAIKKDLEKKIAEAGLVHLFGQVLIPSAKMKNLFEAEPVRASKADHQLFPGYLLVEMELSPESMRLVLDSPRVMRFLGGREPVPLAQREIDRILSQMRGEIAVVSKKDQFVIGSEIEIADGPFAGFVGFVKEADNENERLTVEVSIFGRMTPIELGFNQVKC